MKQALPIGSPASVEFAQLATAAGKGAGDRIEEMRALVEILAARVLAGLPSGCGIEMADLIQAGNVGLLQAARNYEPGTGAPLAGYARFRIRGEMLDTVRRHAGRGGAARVARLNAADSGMDMEASIPAPAEGSPLSQLARRQRSDILGQELGRLPPRYQTVLKLRYGQDCSLRDIGAALQVNESRACQIHQVALGHLRRALSRRGVKTMSHLM